MRRLFWLSVGAAAGYYVARKGSAVVEEARERGLVGNVTLAAGAASKVASTATSAVSSRSRPAPSAAPQPSPAPSTTSRTREARP